MPKFDCMGTKTIEETFLTSNRDEAARWFLATHGVWPSEVGDDTCHGGCEDCGMPLFEGDDYSKDVEEDWLTCGECLRAAERPDAIGA